MAQPSTLANELDVKEGDYCWISAGEGRRRQAAVYRASRDGRWLYWQFVCHKLMSIARRRYPRFALVFHGKLIRNRQSITLAALRGEVLYDEVPF